MTERIDYSILVSVIKNSSERDWLLDSSQHYKSYSETQLLDSCQYYKKMSQKKIQLLDFSQHCKKWHRKDQLLDSCQNY